MLKLKIEAGFPMLLNHTLLFDLQRDRLFFLPSPPARIVTYSSRWQQVQHQHIIWRQRQAQAAGTAASSARILGAIQYLYPKIH